jgi:hypothetical protein
MAYTPSVDFIPEIWAAELNKALWEEFVLKSAVSTKYEGEIKRMGDKVYIPYLVDVSTSTYTGADFTWDSLSGGTTALDCSQVRDYHFAVRDLDLELGSVKTLREEAMRVAAKALVRDHETYALGATTIGTGANTSNVLSTPTTGAAGSSGTVLAASSRSEMVIDCTTAPSKWVKKTAYALGERIIKADAHTTGTGYIYECVDAGTSEDSDTPYISGQWPSTIGSLAIDAASGTYGASTPVWVNVGKLGLGTDSTADAVSASNVYSFFTLAKRMLSEKKAWSKGNMVAVVPSVIIQFIESDTALTHATEKGDELLAAGFYGRLAGFNVLECQNLTGSNTDAAPTNAFFGRNDTVCFAQALVSGPKIHELENNHGVGVKGLSVFGATVPYQRRHAGIRWELAGL